MEAIRSSGPNFPQWFDCTYFQEVIGFSRARAESAFSALVASRIEFGPRDTAVKTAPVPRTSRIGISPHAPYTVSPQLLEKLVSLACRNGMPMAMHVAESREELELLQTGEGPFQELLEERSMWDADAIPAGSRPMSYLKLLADAPRSLVIHGNYLADDELAFVGANRDRMSLVYCPRTHAYFNHEPYPLRTALASGVRVTLGTDSRASNPDLSLLEEMRFVARAYPDISPHDVLRMGTLSGAESLGRDDEVGSITVGKLANLVAVPIAADAKVGLDGALESVLSGDEQVSNVWVRGVRITHGRYDP
jgi:cytosine/adenosine deaminase-related metal-dependent hydrolase